MIRAKIKHNKTYDEILKIQYIFHKDEIDESYKKSEKLLISETNKYRIATIKLQMILLFDTLINFVENSTKNFSF